MTVSELKKGFVSIERVKKGGQKIVYKATRPDTSIVALKVINNATDPRVLQEIEVVQKLPIKNIPQILEHGVVHDELIDEDVLYIVEEFVEGVSMRDYLSAGKKMNLAYEFMLNNAENQIAEFKKRGISGQNRDFAPAIEANRVAMCANDEDYGLKLQFDWRR